MENRHRTKLSRMLFLLFFAFFPKISHANPSLTSQDLEPLVNAFHLDVSIPYDKVKGIISPELEKTTFQHGNFSYQFAQSALSFVEGKLVLHTQFRVEGSVKKGFISVPLKDTFRARAEITVELVDWRIRPKAHHVSVTPVDPRSLGATFLPLIRKSIDVEAILTDVLQGGVDQLFDVKSLHEVALEKAAEFKETNHLRKFPEHPTLALEVAEQGLRLVFDFSDKAPEKPVPEKSEPEKLEPEKKAP